MAERVTGLALGDRAEQRGHVRVALDVGLLREVEVAAVRLALARERLLEVVLGLASLEIGHGAPSSCGRWCWTGARVRVASGAQVVAHAAEDHLDGVDAEVARGTGRAARARRSSGTSRTSPHDGADEVVVVVLDVGIDADLPVPRSSSADLTERLEVVHASGTRSSARSSASRRGPRRRAPRPSGAGRCRASRRKIAWRCGVTRRPWVRKSVGELSRLVCIGDHAIDNDCRGQSIVT